MQACAETPTCICVKLVTTLLQQVVMSRIVSALDIKSLHMGQHLYLEYCRAIVARQDCFLGT